MYYFLLLILFLLVMSYFREEGYLNYEELSFKGVKKNCPQIHANNYHKIVSSDKLNNFFGNYASEFSDIHYKKKEEEKISKGESDNKIKSAYQMIQPFGYTKNELFDMTRFIETDIPLPTDPDFFKHI